MAIHWKYLNRLILYIALICYCYSSNAQSYYVTGVVYDEVNVQLQNVNVVVSKTDSNVILSYTITDKLGFYKLELPAIDSLQIRFSHLGHRDEIRKNISNQNSNSSLKNLTIDVTMSPESFSLDEVIVQERRPVKISKDTIAIRTEKYANGSESTIEELLKKIPGINITSKGKIKIGNQEIEKLMVDGDDLFEKGYRILSKNMPAYAIDEIEILKNYSNNSLLKGIEQSDKVALNLKLKENAKRVWFGNLNSAYGLASENRYDVKGNLMNFGSKNKYYFLASLNNIGKDATEDIEALIKPFRVNQPSNIGDNQQLYRPIKFQKEAILLNEQRTNFNNSELLSLNAIFNPTNKLKIKTLLFFDWDEKDFYKNTFDNISINETNFRNTEQYSLENNNERFFGKVDLFYTVSKTKMIESNLKFSKVAFKDNSMLIFNDSPSSQTLNSSNTLFDQKLTYSDKFKKNKVLLLTSRFIDELAPQSYNSNRFFYQELFLNFDETNNIVATSNSKFQFAGIDLHVLDRKKNGDLFEWQLGNEYRKDKLASTFSLLQGATLLAKPKDFQNDIKYSVNNLYFKTKYRLSIDDLGLTGKIEAHQLFNTKTTSNSFSDDSETALFLNPSLGLDWQINSGNKINASFSYNTSNAKVQDVSNNYLLTSFRNFERGTGTFNQLSTSKILLNYQLGNWSDRLFVNSFVIYITNHDFFSSNTFVNQNYLLSEKIVIKDRENLNLESNVDYYFKKISTNLKLHLGYSQANYKNIINDSNIRNIKSETLGLGFELRSVYKGIFNYHLGSKLTNNKISNSIINTFNNSSSFINLNFSVNERLYLDIITERYFFKDNNEANAYSFLDLNSNYKFKNDKLILGISGKNLLNTTSFKNLSISEIGTSATDYRLLPRYILFKLEYRF